MNHFINLKSRVINKLHIVEIIKNPNLYEIHMDNRSTNGFGFWIFGYIKTSYTKIKICETEDKQDYETITELLNGKFE